MSDWFSNLVSSPIKCGYSVTFPKAKETGNFGLNLDMVIWSEEKRLLNPFEYLPHYPVLTVMTKRHRVDELIFSDSRRLEVQDRVSGKAAL